MKSGNPDRRPTAGSKKAAVVKEPQPEYMESEQDVLFILKVNMWEGMSKFIKFRIGNSPEELAYQFCEEHQLSTEIYDFICESLRQKLWQFNTGQLVDSSSKAVQTKSHPAQKPRASKVNRYTDAADLQSTDKALETSPRDTRDELLMQRHIATRSAERGTGQPRLAETGKVSFHPTSWTIDERLTGNLQALQSSNRQATQPKNASPAIEQTAALQAPSAGKPEARSSTPDYIRSRFR